MDFEWDPAKAQRNRASHAVFFLEAADVVGDELSSTVANPDHSQGERRKYPARYRRGTTFVVIDPKSQKHYPVNRALREHLARQS